MNENNYGVSVSQILKPALKRWWVILIATVLGAVLLFGYTYFFVEPMYTSTARIGIKVINDNMSAYNDSLTGQKVANECSDILLSDITLDRVTEELNKPVLSKSSGTSVTYTNGKLRGMITTIIDPDTRYFDVNVKGNDPEEVKRVCETVINAFCDVLKEKKLINEAEGIILNYPQVPTGPSSPNLTLNVVIGAMLGAIISLAVFVVIGFFKDSIDGEDWLISEYKDRIPMLAVIPDANSSSGGYKKYAKRYGYGYGYHPSDKTGDR